MITKASLLPIAISLVVGLLTGFNIDASIGMYPVLVVMTILVLISQRLPIVNTFAIMFSVATMGIMIAQKESSVTQGYDYEGTMSQCKVVVMSEPTEKAKSVEVDVVNIADGSKLKCYLQKDSSAAALAPGNCLDIVARFNAATGYLLHHDYAGRCYVKSENWQWCEGNALASENSRKVLGNISRITRLKLMFMQWRHFILKHYKKLDISGDAYAVVAAMTLGDKTALNRSLRDTYAVSGASHILALSGMHLGIICSVLMLVTASRRQRSVWSQTLLVMSIWGFALLVGLPTSVVRSALMISLFAVLSLGYRQNISVNSLCVAAIVILLCSPYAIYDTGFQLSFAAVFSIVTLLPVFAPQYKPLSFVKGCVLVSLAAQIGVAPIIAYHFGSFSTYFLLTNIVAIPAAYIIICGALLMMVFPPLSVIVVFAANTLNTLLGYITKMPLASIEGLHPSIVQVALYYVLVAILMAAYCLRKGYYPESLNRWDS